jgi:magnesium-transporting ATPase (P-type)
VWIETIFSPVCQNIFQSRHSLGEHWSKWVCIQFLPDLSQLAFHVVLFCDYSIFHLLFCMCEEWKVRRWEIQRTNWMSNSSHCLSGEILLNLRPFWHFELSVCPSSGSLRAMRFVFVLCLDVDWICFCEKRRGGPKVLFRWKIWSPSGFFWQILFSFVADAWQHGNWDSSFMTTCEYHLDSSFLKTLKSPSEM